MVVLAGGGGEQSQRTILNVKKQTEMEKWVQLYYLQFN